MVAQLERPSRITRPFGDAKNYAIVASNAIKDPSKVMQHALQKPLTINFLSMCFVAGVFDIFGLFANETPGVGIVISVIADIIFIPWFYFSGIKFNAKRIGSMAGMNILEDIPIVGNLPFILLNVIYSYYSN